MRYALLSLAAAVMCLTAIQLVTATNRTNTEIVRAAIDIQALTRANRNLPIMVVADPI
jgi:hypothetical protein